MQVFDRTVDDDTVVAEMRALLALVLDAAGVGAADRALVEQTLTTGGEQLFVDVDWGTLYLPAPTPSTRTLTLTRPGLQPANLPTVHLLGSVDPVVTELDGRGYACSRDRSLLTCEAEDGREITAGVVDEAVVSLSLWWRGATPGPEAPLLTDAYAVLAADGGPRAAGVRQGLAKMAREQPEQLFVSGFRVSRWTNHYAVDNIAFP